MGNLRTQTRNLLGIALLLLAIALLPFLSHPALAHAKGSSGLSLSITRAATGKLTMRNGSTYSLGVKAAKGTAVSYKSSNSRAVKLLGKGKIKGIRSGRSTIQVIATKGKARASKKIKVRVVPAGKFKRVSTIALKTDSGILRLGQSKKLKTTIRPSKASNKNLVYKSSNSRVLSISATGKLKALARGRAKVTVTSADNKRARKSLSFAVIKRQSSPVTISPISISLNMSQRALAIGESFDLTATVLPIIATDRSVTWTSSDTRVVAAENGRITGMSAGYATVTATTTNGLTATCFVTVYAPVINPTSVSLNTTNENLQVGYTLTLTANVFPENATNRSVAWSSSDTSVVTVNNGVVRAVSPGIATVRVYTINALTASCTVNVYRPTINTTGISLDKHKAALQVGESQMLTATVSPQNATDKTVTWSSSNESVARVDDGKVTAISPGIAVVTAMTAMQQKETCIITVSEATVEPTGISLNRTSAGIQVGGTAHLTATVSPSNATDKTVTWSSSNSSIATVDGGTVRGVAPGTATVTARTANGKAAACAITVSAATVEPAGISLDRQSATLRAGDLMTLTATVSPDNATDKSVIWSSSNTSVATVADGHVTGKSSGTATVTARTANGRTAQCTITVSTRKGNSIDDYAKAATELINSTGILPSKALAEQDEFFSGRLIVKDDGTDIDFAPYNPTGVVRGTRRITLVQFDSSDAAREAEAKLRNAAHVVWVEADGYIGTEDTLQTALAATTSFHSWGVQAIGADVLAESLSSKGGSVTVAVVDSGVSSHSLIGNRKLSGGWDFVDGDSDPSDKNNHGTHVAGTVVDCTPGLKVNILPERTQDEYGKGDQFRTALGIEHAVEHGADVINLSQGGGHSNCIEDAIQYAVSKGVTVCVSAGNDNRNIESYTYCPAHIKDAITVGAVSRNFERASFSNYGSSVDVVAPGVNIESSVPGGGYISMSGTSMAAPHISAAAAMVKLAHPSYSPAQIAQTIESCARDLGVSGRDDYYGYGLPDLSKLATIEPTGVSLSRTSATVQVGGTVAITATVSPSHATNKTVTWSSNNASVATVGDGGTVRGVSPGTATVTARTSNGKTATCTITVRAAVIEPMGISLSRTSASVEVMKTASLTATVSPSNATDKTVTWSSSDESIATVSGGAVTGVSPGTATVTARTSNGKTATCTITVTSYEAKFENSRYRYFPSGTVSSWEDAERYCRNLGGHLAVISSASENEFLYGYLNIMHVQNAYFGYSDSESEGNWKWVSGESSSYTNWHSGEPNGETDDEDYAMFYWKYTDGTWNDGNFGHGTVSDDTGFICEWNEATTIEPTGITLNFTSASVRVGSTVALTATVSPSNATDKTVTWTSSDTSVATVSGGTVTGVSPGTTTVTARTVNGKTAACMVTVADNSVAVSRITIDGANPMLNSSASSSDHTRQLTATLYPNNATDRSVTWSSSNPSIAAISSSGLVTGVSGGTATITARASSGVSDAFVVCVSAGGYVAPTLALQKSGASGTSWRDFDMLDTSSYSAGTVNVGDGGDLRLVFDMDNELVDTSTTYEISFEIDGKTITRSLCLKNSDDASKYGLSRIDGTWVLPLDWACTGLSGEYEVNIKIILAGGETTYSSRQSGGWGNATLRIHNLDVFAIDDNRGIDDYTARAGSSTGGSSATYGSSVSSSGV